MTPRLDAFLTSFASAGPFTVNINPLNKWRVIFITAGANLRAARRRDLRYPGDCPRTRAHARLGSIVQLRYVKSSRIPGERGAATGRLRDDPQADREFRMRGQPSGTRSREIAQVRAGARAANFKARRRGCPYVSALRSITLPSRFNFRGSPRAKRAGKMQSREITVLVATDETDERERERERERGSEDENVMQRAVRLRRVGASRNGFINSGKRWPLASFSTT